MKRLYLFYFFIFNSFYIVAQEIPFNSVDHTILAIPTDATVSTDSIASFINARFKTGREKFLAIHRWVTYNIKYSSDSMYVFNWGGDQHRKITEALRRRKGVCENYTAIFNDIALKCGLQSYVVSGYTKQSGNIDKSGHSWCAVKDEEGWLFCDPTWDEAYRDNPNYFFIAPALFIESHMPFDPLWQLLEYPVTPKDFIVGIFTWEKNG